MRLVIASEPSKAGQLDAVTLKQITGGDQINTRNIYQENSVYYPEFKLWFAANSEPRISDTDDGIWRRVHKINFNVQIPKAQQIPEFHKVLFAKEGSGIVNRLLEGIHAWQEDGHLIMPPEVQDATDKFRLSQNVIEDFFDTYCTVGKPNLHAKMGFLYLAYKSWAEVRGETVLRTNEFAEVLDRRPGLKRKSVWHDGMHCFGLTLKSQPMEDSPVVFEN
jgi:putative DNA primase/helicase